MEWPQGVSDWSGPPRAAAQYFATGWIAHMAGRGPHREPRSLTELKGNSANRSARRLAEHEPAPQRAPGSGWPPPAHLDAVAKREWRRLVGPMAAAGMLSIVDRDVLASFCVLHSRHLQAEAEIAKGGAVIAGKSSPWVVISRDAMAMKLRYAAQLGLTSVSRSTMHVTMPSPLAASDDAAEAGSYDEWWAQ